MTSFTEPKGPIELGLLDGVWLAQKDPGVSKNPELKYLTYSRVIMVQASTTKTDNDKYFLPAFKKGLFLNCPSLYWLNMKETPPLLKLDEGRKDNYFCCEMQCTQD